MSFRRWLSIGSIPRELSRTWHIVLRKYVLINFNLEKLLSALATVTGMVNQSINQSKHISIAPYIASESEGQVQQACRNNFWEGGWQLWVLN